MNDLLIDQDCINMFETTNPLAFIMRIALFCLLFCCFPLVNHFLRSLAFQILFRGRTEIDQKTFTITTISLLMVPTLVAIIYPKVASVLGIIGSVAGLIIVYILPVITYLKKVKTECENPILAKALDKNMYEVNQNTSHLHMSPKIVVNNALLRE